MTFFRGQRHGLGVKISAENVTIELFGLKILYFDPEVMSLALTEVILEKMLAKLPKFTNLTLQT